MIYKRSFPELIAAYDSRMAKKGNKKYVIGWIVISKMCNPLHRNKGNNMRSSVHFCAL